MGIGQFPCGGQNTNRNLKRFGDNDPKRLRRKSWIGKGKIGGREMKEKYFKRLSSVLAVFTGIFGILAPVQAAPLTLEVYDPTGAMEVTELHAPRLDTLDGKTICELSNDSWQAHRVLPEVQRLLHEKFPSAKFISHSEFPVGNDGIDNDKTADLVAKRGCQAVVIGDAG